MQVHFTREQLAQLSQIATHAGTDPEHLVKDAALRLVEEDAKFRAAVRRALSRPTGESLTTMKRWLHALSGACTRNEPPVD